MKRSVPHGLKPKGKSLRPTSMLRLLLRSYPAMRASSLLGRRVKMSMLQVAKHPETFKISGGRAATETS